MQARFYSLEQGIKMEKMKINSKTQYNRNRVLNGQGPHKMMKMLHQKMMTKIAKEGKKDSSMLFW